MAGQRLLAVRLVLPTYLRLLASAVVSPTIVVGVRAVFSNVSFLRFSLGGRRQGVEVFEETGPRKTGGAKVPFDNFDPENYLGDAGLRNAAT
jgi:hypothetical protein